MRLTVRISSHPGEFEVPRDQDTGELVIGADQQVIVSRQPDGSAGGGLRLFFRIRTPRVASRNRLRCQLFHEGTLLQSREISVSVTDDDEDALFAQNTQVTYAGPAPDGRHRVAPGSLSIDADGRDRNVERLLLNGFGLHGSADTGAMDLALPATQQAALYQEMRDCLASVLYRKNPTIEDDAGTFHGTFPYAAGTPESWENDLVKLACVGQQNWGTVAGRVVAAYGDDLDGPLPAGFGEEGPIYRFTRLLQQPTVIELANTAEARQSIPAALFYDHPFDVTGKSVQLCATFRAAVDEARIWPGQRVFSGTARTSRSRVCCAPAASGDSGICSECRARRPVRWDGETPTSPKASRRFGTGAGPAWWSAWRRNSGSGIPSASPIWGRGSRRF